MSLRETLERYPDPAKWAAGSLIALCLCAIGWELFGGRHEPSATQMNQAFYSDDDGQTCFADDASKSSPFDHNGKPAYRALVFRGSNGKSFVAYLKRYSDAQKAQIDAEIARDPKSASHWLSTPMQEIKKPGDAAWAVNKSAMPGGLPPITCPDGSTNPTQVFPGDRLSE